MSCGSSATTSTAPSPLVRCSLTLTSADQMVPAAGGTGTVAIAATRECTWTASAESAWLSVRSGQSGQGDGMVEFAAARNPDPASRRGALVVNGQRAEITQEAGTCDITLATSSASFTPDGGSGRVEVRASSSLCPWTATSSDSWIQIRSGSDGRGSGAVMFDVAAATGPPRSGALTIAGQRFSVTQSEGCTFSIAPAAQNVFASGRHQHRHRDDHCRMSMDCREQRAVAFCVAERGNRSRSGRRHRRRGQRSIQGGHGGHSRTALHRQSVGRAVPSRCSRRRIRSAHRADQRA